MCGIFHVAYIHEVGEILNPEFRIQALDSGGQLRKKWACMYIYRYVDCRVELENNLQFQILKLYIKFQYIILA